MMSLDELNSLKNALDTGNVNFFHGDFQEAFKNVVSELIEFKEREETRAEKISDMLDKFQTALMNL